MRRGAILAISVSACGGGDDVEGGEGGGGGGTLADAGGGGGDCPGFTSAASCPAGCERTIENAGGMIWCGQPCSDDAECEDSGYRCGVYGYCAPTCAINSECAGFQGCGADNVCSLCQEDGPC